MEASAEIAIRALTREEPPELFARIARLLACAYPVMRLDTAEALAAFAERAAALSGEPHTMNVIAEREGQLAGMMRLYDFRMNVRGRDAFAGGVGSVAVDAAHKRRGVAHALIAWYLEHYRARNATFAILHPFRPDFYRALGFGYGTPSYRFRFATGTLRDAGARGRVRILGPDDAELLERCSERVRAVTNGLIERHRSGTERALSDPQLRYVAVEDGDGELRGFMQTHVLHGPDELRNRDELVVRDITCESEAACAALFGYLRSQRDQFGRVAIETQDPALFLASDDPRDGSDEAVAPPATHRVATMGLGVMYRVLDVDAAFAHLGAAPAPFVLDVSADDALVPEAGGSRRFRFGPDGPPVRDDAAIPDARLSLGIADLSSLLVGSLRLRDAVRGRVASLEPAERLAEVDAALASAEPPRCTTRF